MHATVITFPGSNCDRDVATAIAQTAGCKAYRAWHADTDLPKTDLIVIPGGFSWGDYLRTGAMAAHAPIMAQVKSRAANGVRVLGICNGFQILCEAGLLPGALVRNRAMKFICKNVELTVENTTSDFTHRYPNFASIRLPIAHGEGNYVASAEALSMLEDKGHVVFRYKNGNPNGSANSIAGIINETGNVLGMMPHPERAVDDIHESKDGILLFKSLLDRLG